VLESDEIDDDENQELAAEAAKKEDKTMLGAKALKESDQKAEKLGASAFQVCCSMQLYKILIPLCRWRRRWVLRVVMMMTMIKNGTIKMINTLVDLVHMLQPSPICRVASSCRRYQDPLVFLLRIMVKNSFFVHNCPFSYTTHCFALSSFLLFLVLH